MADFLDVTTPESITVDVNVSVSGIVSGQSSNQSGNVRVADQYTQPLYITIGALGIISNAFVILVICHSKQMRQKVTNIFIIHQSVVDLIVAFFLVLTTATSKESYNLEGIRGEFICRLWLTSLPLWSSVLTSTYNLVALTVERYLEICHPIKHKISFTANKAGIVIAIIWLLGLVHQLPTHLPTARVVDGKCYVLAFWTSKTANKVFGVFNFLIRYFIPLAIMIASYSAMIRVLRTQGSNINGVSKHQDRMTRARNNVFKTLLIVALGFILCWTLNQLLFFMFTFGFKLDFGSWWYNLSVVLVNVNCCINPFIYAAKYEAFQKSVRKIFCKGSNSVDPMDASHSGMSVTATSKHATTVTQVQPTHVQPTHGSP